MSFLHARTLRVKKNHGPGHMSCFFRVSVHNLKLNYLLEKYLKEIKIIFRLYWARYIQKCNKKWKVLIFFSPGHHLVRPTYVDFPDNQCPDSQVLQLLADIMTCLWLFFLNFTTHFQNHATSSDTEKIDWVTNLVSNGPACPCENLRTHLRT